MSMINKKSLLFIFCFALTGCTMDCVEPGLENRNASINVEIPLHKENAGTKIHWVNSGQVINKDDKIKFNVHGSISFCPSKNNTKTVLVPAGFCADGSEPNYKEAENISTVPDKYGIDESKLCEGHGGFGSSSRLYVDTEIKVNPGDKLSFDLVPRKIKIDCDNLRGKITFDDSDDRNGGIKVTEEEICKEGIFKGSDGIERKFSSHNKEYGVLIGNGYTPYDNKVHFNIRNGDPWITGALLDFRRKKEGLNELCNGQPQGTQDNNKCTIEQVKKYGPYERNCYYQNICYSEKGIGPDKNCVSSVRYKEYNNNGQCDMYSYLEHVGSDKKPVLRRNLAITEGLIGKISSPYTDYSVDILYNATGTQCLPKDKGANGKSSVCSEIGSDFTDFSLELNHDYTINSGIIPGSSVMLGIVHNNDASAGLKRGGYHVQVTRSCEYTNGEKLYVYLGNKPPEDNTLTSGSDNFKSVLKLDKVIDDNVDYYIIDGSHLSDGKSEEIYFGINVSNIKEDELKDEKGEYYENNKYDLTLFVKKKMNTFLSSTVNNVLKFVIDEKSGSSIKDTYEVYRKGLSQAVRALLTLYIIFTVVGYMLGTVQLNKFDFIVRIVKIAFVTFAFSERSWEFGIMLSKFFVDGSSSLVDTFSGYIGEGGGKFAFLDLTAGVLFTGETWLKFLSLMLAGPFGFIAFLMILKASFMFIKCIISATFKYVISSLLVAFLLSLTPLFITFILFQQTKPLFDGWIKTIAHIGIQPVILFSSLSLLNQLMYSILYNLTNFSACYQCLISVNFLSYDLCLFRSILPLGYSPSTGVDVALSGGERVGGYFGALPIDLVQAFMYLMLASAMEAFTSASEAMSQSMFGPSFGVVGNIGAVSHSTSQSLLSTVGLDGNTQNMIQNIKQKMGKDRAKVEVKSSGSTKSEAPKK
ncbi:MAG: hypothetical protein PG981_000925 [Wolbachia endosymbiont of Ctenocephalides orientis wCori]|nr:MAG: hypothetical protein PG981_000925 [Wolbachia endosymbiont of Ctenocephalides orientis wCori]